MTAGAASVTQVLNYLINRSRAHAVIGLVLRHDDEEIRSWHLLGFGWRPPASAGLFLFFFAEASVVKRSRPRPTTSSPATADIL